MPGNYELVFDAAASSSGDWTPVFVGMTISVTAAIFLVFPRFRALLPLGNKVGSSYFGFIFIFALLFTGIVNSARQSSDSRIGQASENNSCESIEGIVQDLEPMPYGGQKKEAFRVKDQHFEYSDYAYTGGFNNSKSHGGPIFEGMTVKICYIQSTRKNTNIIARLEIMR